MKLQNKSIFKGGVLLTFAVAVFAVAGTQFTQGAVVRMGDTYIHEDNKTIEDDLYLLNNRVSLYGTTTGDVLAAGSEIFSEGRVLEDLQLAAGSTTVTSFVGGDLRIFGGKIEVKGHVTEDAFLIGGEVIIGPSAVIEGELFVLAESIEYRGTTSGAAKIHGDKIVIEGGTFGSNVNVTAENTVSITGQSTINGDLVYKSRYSASISDDSVILGEVREEAFQPKKKFGDDTFFSLAFKVLVAIVAAVSLVFFFPRQTRRMVEIVLRESPWNVAKGALILLAVPFIVVFLFVSMIGVLPGFLALFTYGATIALAFSLTPVVAAVILVRWLKKTDDEFSIAWVSLGAIVFILLGYLYIVGFLVQLTMFLFSYYAVCALVYETIWKERKEAVVDEDTAEEAGEAKNDDSGVVEETEVADDDSETENDEEKTQDKEEDK